MRLAAPIAWDGAAPAHLAAQLRAAAPADERLGPNVAAIIAAVRERGDDALLELTARFDATETDPASLRLHIGPEAIAAAPAGIDPGLRDALKTAAANIRAYARAQLPLDTTVTLEQGQTVRGAWGPVGAAGIYAPGGRAAYPSSVLMGAIPAREAGVLRVVLATPPNPDGSISPVVLAAAAIAGVDEVIAAGGAQAVAALASGTQTIAPVDVIAGPGNSWVTEAKRQVFGQVGVDGLAGPSELIVIFDPGADLDTIALDLIAQAEHGPDSPLVAIAAGAGAMELLAELSQRVAGLAAERPSAAAAPAGFVAAPDLSAALALSDAFAPEHLELCFEEAGESMAAERIAGCVFIGPGGATAFGDYAAGSNHVLPTAGAARFSGPLSPLAFMRRTSVVSIPAAAAAALGPAVDTIARAEGLPVHGESALRRAGARPDGQNQ